MSEFIGLDIETAGELQEYALQAYRVPRGQARISALSIGSPDAAIGRLEPSKEWIDTILNSLRGKKVVGWNVCFDLSFLVASGCDVSGIEWYDAMLMWMHLTREPDEEKGKPQSFSLETAMKTYFPEDAGFKEYTDFQNVSDGLLHRNKEDARFTAILANKFWSELAPSQRRAVTIESRSLIMIANTYIDGIRIDRDALNKLKSKLDADAKAAYTELLKHQSDIDNYNLGSPKQLGTLLYETWGLTPTKFTDTNQPSTDKFALHDLAQIYPQAKLLRDYRESQNNTAKYADATLMSIDYNGNDITRPQAKIFGTYTGRMTYYSKQGRGKNERPTGVALHQWKRGADFRNLIAAPHGYQIVELDFAGQEFRWMAVASGDETMLALCAPGEDAHSYMGAKVSHQDYRDMVKRVKSGDKEAANDRKLGKFSNLSFQYRISAKAAAVKANVEYGIHATEGYIQGILNSYKDAYPGVPRYWFDAENKARSLGYAETFAGRRVQLRGPWTKQRQWALGSTAINYPIQGTGGDQKYLALAVANTFLKDYNARFYYDLHDGMYFVVPDDKAKTLAVKLLHTFSNLPYKLAWGREFPIQFPVDCKIGPSWGQLKDLEV